MDSIVPEGNTHEFSRRHFVQGLGFAASCVFMSGLTGCRFSDTLYETYYVDWSDDIDYDNEMKNVVNRPDKDPTSTLPRLYETESEEDEEEVELPEYDDIPDPDEDEDTSQEKYDASSSNDGASSSGSTDGVDGTDADDSSGDGEGTGDEGNSGEEADDAGEGEEPSDSNAGDGEKDQEVGASVGGNEQGTNPTKSDAMASPDKTGGVIAFGEMANIALMLSGSGGEGLWAADDTFCKKATSVYASSYDPSGIRSGYWGSYNSSSTTMSTEKFNTLCADIESSSSKPVYLIYDDSIGCPLTTTQVETLSDSYGIETIYFSVNRRYYLRSAMNYMQKVLADFGAKSVYKSYWDFHDGLLDSINDGKVGAWSGGTTTYRCFDPDASKSSYSASNVLDEEKSKWTLVIDDWDDSVSYKYGSLSSTAGLGISHVGWTWSPVSYYLQCGGVINNGAAWRQSTGSSDKVSCKYVWQFHAKTGMPKGSNLSGASLSGDNVFSSTSDGTDNVLDVLLLAKNDEYGAGKLGSVAQFPAVIVRDSAMKKNMQKSCVSGGVYGAHYLRAGATNNNSVASVGIRQSSGAQWKAYVGYIGSGVEVSSGYRDTDSPYDIYINPHGIYSSWLDGSVEAVLEAAWACETFGISSLSTKYGDSASAIVEYFYNTFYGQKPSDVDKILDGDYA